MSLHLESSIHTRAALQLPQAIIISIRPANQELRLEKWELAAPSQRPATRATSNQTPIPTQVQEITICGSAVTGAPLVLGFEQIFLRSAVPPQGDVTLSEEDLRGWAAKFWASMQEPANSGSATT